MLTKYKISQQFLELTQNVQNIKSYFSRSDTSIHKARNELKISSLSGVEVVIKSFKIPHLLNRIVYSYFRDSKAKKSYDYSIKLQELNISTPEPIAYIEFHETSLLKNSYFINRHIDYDFTIREVLLNENWKDHDVIFQEFAKFTYDLHQKGVFHLDYSPGNILIKMIEGNYTFFLVDINRMKFGVVSKEDGFKNFNKLWATIPDMTIMAKAYAKVAGYDEIEAIKKMVMYDAKNKRVKNFKKRLKRQK